MGGRKKYLIERLKDEKEKNAEEERKKKKKKMQQILMDLLTIKHHFNVEE